MPNMNISPPGTAITSWSTWIAANAWRWPMPSLMPSRRWTRPPNTHGGPPMLDAAHEMEHMAQAEARKRRTEIEEFEHQKAYQQCRNRLNYLRGQIRSL